MFWGLNLKPNRKYSQTTSKSFHISQAALEADSSQGGTNQIFISCDNQKFLICTLRKEACEQVMLDLNFAEGEEICFQSIGSGNVSLSGYLIEDDSMNFMDGDDESEEESEVEAETDLRNTLNKKAKKGDSTKAAKAALAALVGAADDDDEDEDDSDFNGEDAPQVEDDDDSEEDDDEEGEDDDDEDEDEEDESEEEEVQQPKAKQPKLDKPQKQQNGVAKETVVEKKGKKDKKDKKDSQPQQQKAGGERVITGGVKVEDIRVGNGPEAKTGKRAAVYYEGRLKTNNKVFDSLKNGAGFKFGLGRGEVIKGWDVGVAGMKVGGKRRITCPPHMAYGARGSPPTIPANSTLVFEVELKSVN